MIRIMIEAEEIKNRIREVGNQISRDYKGRHPILVGVLNGAFIFCADLVRCLDIPIKLDFISVSSYEGTESTGSIRVNLDTKIDLKGYNK